MLTMVKIFILFICFIYIVRQLKHLTKCFKSAVQMDWHAEKI